MILLSRCCSHAPWPRAGSSIMTISLRCTRGAMIIGTQLSRQKRHFTDELATDLPSLHESNTLIGRLHSPNCPGRSVRRDGKSSALRDLRLSTSSTSVLIMILGSSLAQQSLPASSKVCVARPLLDYMHNITSLYISNTIFKYRFSIHHQS